MRENIKLKLETLTALIMIAIGMRVALIYLAKSQQDTLNIEVCANNNGSE